MRTRIRITKWKVYGLFPLLLIIAPICSHALKVEEKNHFHSQVKRNAKFCDTSLCRNGKCYIYDVRRICICGVYFHGPRCEFVDLTATKVTAKSTKVIVEWESPPHLKGYYFIYRKHGESEYKAQPISMGLREREVTLTNLNFNQVSYLICIVEKDTAHALIGNVPPRAYANLNSTVPECTQIVTGDFIEDLGPIVTLGIVAYIVGILLLLGVAYVIRVSFFRTTLEVFGVPELPEEDTPRLLLDFIAREFNLVDASRRMQLHEANRMRKSRKIFAKFKYAQHCREVVQAAKERQAERDDLRIRVSGFRIFFNGSIGTSQPAAPTERNHYTLKAKTLRPEHAKPRKTVQEFLNDVIDEATLDDDELGDPRVKFNTYHGGWRPDAIGSYEKAYSLPTSHSRKQSLFMEDMTNDQTPNDHTYMAIDRPHMDDQLLQQTIQGNSRLGQRRNTSIHDLRRQLPSYQRRMSRRYTVAQLASHNKNEEPEEGELTNSDPWDQRLSGRKESTIVDFRRHLPSYQERTRRLSERATSLGDVNNKTKRKSSYQDFNNPVFVLDDLEPFRDVLDSDTKSTNQNPFYQTIGTTSDGRKVRLNKLEEIKRRRDTSPNFDLSQGENLADLQTKLLEYRQRKRSIRHSISQQGALERRIRRLSTFEGEKDTQPRRSSEVKGQGQKDSGQAPQKRVSVIAIDPLFQNSNVSETDHTLQFAQPRKQSMEYLQVPDFD